MNLKLQHLIYAVVAAMPAVVPLVVPPAASGGFILPTGLPAGSQYEIAFVTRALITTLPTASTAFIVWVASKVA